MDIKYEDILIATRNHLNNKKHLMDNDDFIYDEICQVVNNYDNNIELVERLFNDTVKYSVLTPYIKETYKHKNDIYGIEEINMMAYNNIVVTHEGGKKERLKYGFLSAKHAKDTITKLILNSKQSLNDSQPIIVTDYNKNERITVVQRVVDDEVGVAFSIRFTNNKELSKDDLVKYNSASCEMLDMLSSFFTHGISMCISGATDSGKTSLMVYLLKQIADDTRLITIEDGTREFSLLKYDQKQNPINEVVHLCTKFSSNEDYRVTSEDLLKLALTMNPDIICMAEMKGSETFWAQEASRTGHTVISTTHAQIPSGTINRIVTQSLGTTSLNYDIMEKLVCEAFPIIVTTKKLKDNSRKIMEICEVYYDGKAVFNTLYKYDITKNKHIKVNNISDNLKQLLKYNEYNLLEVI